MKQIFRYILIGTLSLIPLFIVIQLMLWIKTISMELFDFVSFYTNNPLYTGAIFIVTILILALIGSSIERVGKSFFISQIDKILAKVPAIGSVYAVIKKITALFTPSKKDDRKEVVLVEYPKDDIWVPAYVLNKHKEFLVLFVPTSPNPTSGYTVIVDEKKTKRTSLTITQASKFIISMGAEFVKKEEVTSIIRNYEKNSNK